MPIIGKIASSLFSSGAATLVGEVGQIIDNVHVSDEERMAGELAQYRSETDRMRVENKNVEKQLDINKAAANHPSIFVAGWRSGIGWIGALALLYHFLLYPFMLWGIAIVQAFFGVTIIPPPDIDIAPLMGLVASMLGVGAMRSFEKSKGIQRDRLVPAEVVEAKKAIKAEKKAERKKNRRSWFSAKR